MVGEQEVPHRRSNHRKKTKMKKTTQRGPVTLGSAIGKLLTPTLTLAAAVAVLPSYAGEIDLAIDAAPGITVDVVGDVGGTAKFADHWEQPTGTGVFKPFLTLDSNGQTSTGNTAIESAYNTDGAPLYLDELRNHWNTLLKVGDLQNVNGYYQFILDANEPGQGKSLISIDNIRIYTSSDVNTPALVQNDITKLDNLGDLRWAMNDKLSEGAGVDLNGFNVDTWVKLDSDQNNNDGSNSNGGSGQGDMIVNIPVTAFGNAGAEDYVWFYNLNGVHYTADGDLAAEAGFEEWKARVGPNEVPDGGNTLVLFGTAIAALGVLARRRQVASVVA
jgi:hypothetical protein